MPRTDDEPNLLASLLDRLLDDEPGEPSEPPSWNRQDVALIKRSIARDLEALLNTRMVVLDEGDLPAGCVELAHSTVTYGLPDFLSLSPSNPKDRNRVRRVIEQAIEAFEPRLKNVRVIVDPLREHEYQRALHFRIEAVLPVDPIPEAVTFDTDLQLHSQKYVIRGQH